MNTKMNTPKKYSRGALFRDICTFLSGGVSTAGS